MPSTQPSMLQSEPIAIIGTGCRFPGGASTPSKLWDLLRSPRDVSRDLLSAGRFDQRGFYHPDHQFPGPSNVRRSYLLEENVANFDARFFNIQVTEAAAMDPQQRILLETVYESLEAAGQTLEGLKGSDTGVYVGMMYGDYESQQYRDLQNVPLYHGTGVARSMVSNRISYFFDWHGPSLTVDTACSSSLVALHQAVQSLRSGEVTIAVAAGTNLLLGPEPYIYESNLKMLSPDGRSRMWGDDANGYARGDGVAAVVLKTLRQALADGDHIECVVRESGVNQDGRSPGITMPTAKAQVALIRDVYARAGLDLTSPVDRCQYVEAHGTGTPAGDPVEAEAIHTAFFQNSNGMPIEINDADKIVVGSIKTVIGHTESTAGLAAIVKVAQALNHGQIPPNGNRVLDGKVLDFTMNPRVEPWCKNLRIASELTPWPKVAPGQCRRASINSFGFGGTNAHVILESLGDDMQVEHVDEGGEGDMIRSFVFSAQSKQSLIANLAAHAAYLSEHPDTRLADLAWTLRSRRSRFPLLVALSASSVEMLRSSLLKITSSDSNKLQLDQRLKLTTTGSSATTKERKAKLLGIFTGQGAQWARMGAQLVETSKYASDILSKLDAELANLPNEQDRPNWTLRKELLADANKSRVGDAAISQPLCTAVQVILVDLLREAGVEFAAVVGHSSGEIGAAYYTGRLSATDAIRIAYYRGLHSTRLAGGPNGAQGAMVAVSTNMEDASEVCRDEFFQGRVTVAACNSPNSVTLSGDSDAVEEIAGLFEDEGKTARRLRVDKAYHSHHMIPCSQPYLSSMLSFQSHPSRPEVHSDCVWVSSVAVGSDTSVAELDASYWVDNLLSPVLFKQAVERAVTELGPFDAIVEVGPHPALKGPVRQILEGLKVSQLPYTGILERGTEAAWSMSTALGYLWTHVENISINFDKYENALSGSGSSKPRFVAGLPLYQWNHSHNGGHWHESHTSRRLRFRSSPVHPLLGDICSSSSPQNLSWKAVLRSEDIPWVHDHKIQGQSVFPAAGYAVTVLEAAPFLADGKVIRLVEIEDLVIHQAMVFDNDSSDSSIEVRFSIGGVSRLHDDATVTGHFTYEYYSSNGSLELAASGQMRVIVGEPCQQTLPASDAKRDSAMVNVPTDVLYSSLHDMGYGYTGPFKALSGLSRKLGKAVGLIDTTLAEYNDANNWMAVHPGMLDAAIHSVILAYSYPRDGKLWSLHLPTRIKRIRVNPALCGRHWTAEPVPFVSTIGDDQVHSSDRSPEFRGDVEIHGRDGLYSAIQVEGLQVVPFSVATPSDDRTVFYVTRWVNAEPDADMPGPFIATPEQRKLAEILERGHYFYLRQLDDQVPVDHPGRSDQFNAAYLRWATHTHRLVMEGKDRYGKRAWVNDPLDDIKTLTEPCSELPEVKAMHIVGEQMPRAIRGETTMLHHLMVTGLLNEYYAKALGMGQVTVLADTVLQVTRRYPQANILEVGAGTGGATREVLKLIGNNFGSFTFTDVSAGFFDDAQAEFALYKDQMSFRVLDLEQDPAAQDFEKHSYDIVIGSLVLHATKSLEKTLQKVRSLLRPGGYLIFYEITNVNLIRPTALFGCLPGWWQGVDEGRIFSPAVSESKWDALLRKTGFSGVDTMTPTNDSMPFCNSVLVSQAVDDWVDFVRQPLMTQAAAGASLFSKKSSEAVLKKLFIVGGQNLHVSRFIDGVQKLIRPFCDEAINRVELLEDLDHDQIDKSSTVLVLQDLDQPVFKDMTSERLESLKTLFGSEKTIVWVTHNRLVDNPYSNMAPGFVRPSIWEAPELRYHFVDFQDVPESKIDARALTEVVLRFQVAGSVHNRDQQSKSSKALWSVESEIVIDADGRQRIPRLGPLVDANALYNSSLRQIECDVGPQLSPVLLRKATGQAAYTLQKQQPISLDGSTSTASLKINHSSLFAVRTEWGDAFAASGTCEATGVKYLGLTSSVTSLVNVATSSLVEIPEAVPRVGSETLILTLVACQLVILTIEAKIAGHQAVVVHDAPPMMGACLARSSKAKNITFTTSSRDEAAKNNWTHINEYARQSELESLFPLNVSMLIDFAAETPESSVLANCFPRNVEILSKFTIFAAESYNALVPSTTVGDMLHTAMELALEEVRNDGTDRVTVEEVHISALTSDEDSASSTHSPLTIVNWTGFETLPVTMQPVNVSLRADRTYWLAGLSRDMGLSLADWMVRSGARYIVISSRNPRISQAWLQNAARKGATVLVISCDITDYDSLVEAHATITKSLPPIAGVAQGAMVLNDVLTRDMTLEDLNKVLRPKVDGSINLDRLFHDSPLDFFIFFSSAASVTGNAGQANYSAANFFMGSLAHKRRRRGLAASVIDLGPVLGTGYITREIGDALTRPLAERGLLGMSESDVHCLFAEAINASPVTPGSEVGWHITTGLIPLPAEAPNRPLWYNFPQFACLTIRDPSANDSNKASNTAGGAVVPIKDQLTEAKTKEDVQKVITDNFLKEMCSMLHMGEDFAMTPAVRTDELGLDSLVAVRIRSWFLSHFKVNIPALKIIKGVSLQQLIDQTLNEMPADLTPGLFGASPSADGPEVHPRPEDTKNISAASSSGNTLDSHSTATSETGETRIMTPPPEKELEIERFGPLSYTQSVFMFVHELLEDKTTLNNTGMVHLNGEIRVPDLHRAVRLLGERHEGLRTCFFTEDGVHTQGVLAEPTLELEHRRVFTKADVLSEYDALKNTVFDLRQGHTARVLLLSYSPTDHYSALATHHIIFDRASTDIFMADLARIYKNQNESLATPLQYLNYSNRLHEQHASGKWADAMRFWRREFATIPEPLPLHRSSIPERRPLERYSSRTGLPECEFRIDSTLTTRIRQVARKYRCTPFHFHLAAFKVLLFRWLGTEDVCIGFADGCRRDESMWTGIGPFLNMLPLRMKARTSQSFADAIVESREKSHGALSNAIPLEVILNELKVSRQATHSPLAQAFMNYAETSVESGREFLDCDCEMMAEDQAELPYDIAFTIITNTTADGDADTKIVLNVQDCLYNADAARILANGYEDIFREFADRPDDPLNSKWKFRQSSLSKAIAVGHGPGFNITWTDTIVHKLDALLASIGDRVAVTDGVNKPVTYKELSRQINSIASSLLQEGVTAGSKVAVCQNPTVLWVASVVAILKIGAVYVPLDAATPPARLALMVQDCRPAAVLSNESTREMVGELAPQGAVIDVSNAVDVPAESLPTTALADAPAMVLYTSGSTGTPKGVVLTHESLRHEFEHCEAVYGLKPGDVVLQQSAWSFDLSITQLFLALTVGARLHVASHTLRADGRAMAELIRDENVTTTYATPTEYKAWLRNAHVDIIQQSPWRLALVAGEAVTVPLLRRFRNLGRADSLRLFNVYGPTETTCGSTKMQLDYANPDKYADAVPVGRASANECFYILDNNQSLQPLGLTGEVAIGGVGVAKGYLNNAEQTKASFVPDPFATSEYTRCGWTTMYRTGDAGYLKEDGTLVLKGRLSGDTEVKLNGIRIDLRDVEQTVLKASQGRLADVAACVRTNLSASEDEEQAAFKYMVAYCVFSSEGVLGESYDAESILQRILESLPLSHAMRPSVLVPVDDLPRTTAGKLDRRALADLEIAHGLLLSVTGATRTTLTSTLSNAEARLLELWQCVLPEEVVRHVGIRASSDFFSVGGTSMLLVQLQQKIIERCHVSLTLLDLFRTSTLSGMARVLQRALGPESDVPDTTDGDQFKSIDWARETAFELEVPMGDAKSPSPREPPRVVVLTGATGFLGQHLLRGLLEQRGVEKIICIANRNLTDERRKELLLSPRVECLEGDLCASNLGLTQVDMDRIFGIEADAVIHNGADVSHLKTYASLRGPNVTSTKELARLCLQRRVPLHYVSTTGVTMYTASSTFPEVSVHGSPPPCDGKYGYISSKWASEVYLENANSLCKLPVYIHRPSSVLRPDVGEQTPAADVLQNMLTFSRRVSAVPIAPSLKGFVDLVRPETVTDRLLRAVMTPSRGEEVVYIHESGDIELKVSQIPSYLSKEMGKPIQQVDLADWVRRAEETGLSSAMSAVFLGLGEEDTLNFPRLLRSL